MRFGHDLESIFTLIYTFMTVEVTGEHLAPIVHAIDSEDCKRIHEFHPGLYDPPERGATIIERIRILSEEGEEIGPPCALPLTPLKVFPMGHYQHSESWTQRTAGGPSGRAGLSTVIRP